MLLKRRPLRATPASVLERVWLRKRARFEAVQRDFPGASHGVVWRALDGLWKAGLVRRRRGRTHAKGSPVPYWWKPAPRGLRLLSYLMPYRDWWELLQPRDLAALARAEGLFERLEAVRKTMVPGGPAERRRWTYWERDPSEFPRGPQQPRHPSP